jgi:hypothetical protein
MSSQEGQPDAPPQPDGIAVVAAEASDNPQDGGADAGTPAKLVRPNGASQNVRTLSLADGGVRIEGGEGLRNGEKVLLVRPDQPVSEVSIRWVVGNQAGAVPLA